jgi:bifunctional non-homologous end joining protein LigD
MIKPMLAVPMTKGTINDWNDWAIEEKFDGHRLVVCVERDDEACAQRTIRGVKVTAWTRPRKHAGDVSGKSMNTRPLPAHLVANLSRLPAGVYDGELLGGETSTDVTRTDLAHTLRFVVFDVLQQDGQDVMTRSYDQRREILVSILHRAIGNVSLASAKVVTCQADVTRFVDEVWSRGGEGAILKRRAAPYRPGKRSPDFIKVKKLLTTVCTVVGFEATRGKVLNRGAYATVVLRDDAGHETSVKTVDDAQLEEFNKQGAWAKNANVPHPAIGRKLRIEYQDIAADGGYRHPRWDRWEDE